MITKITSDLVYLGQDDDRIARFENVYPVPRGVSYNSYLLLDGKTVLFDTVDRSAAEPFFRDLREALGERALDCVVVHHMEPDHAGTLEALLRQYPETKVVLTQKALQMFGQFFPLDIAQRAQVVKEGSTLCFGRHTLRFVTAPMVHWPEVMVSFDETDGILFSADAFGTFGSLHGRLYADQYGFEAELLPEMRRYYANIVGKYGAPVQTLLRKAAGLPVKMICPLHGPIWREGLDRLTEKYDRWSRYEPEGDAVVIYTGSVYGHTDAAARALADELNALGVTDVRLYDTAGTDLSLLVAEAFRAGTLVFAAATYNNGIFTPMETLLADLKAHDLQGRRYALIENGSWAPNSGKLMEECLSSMKRMTRRGEILTLRSAMKPEQLAELKALAQALRADE